MRSLSFSYHKPKTIQALRYHFISRKEIKVMMILVNVFALLTAALFFLKKISPLAFLTSSLLWFLMMILFWFLLPNIVFRKSSMFKDKFTMEIDEENFTLFNEIGAKSWPWTAFSFWMESPHFFHLYFNERSFLIVPKDAFEGEAVHEARNQLKNKIKAQGK
jgi:hypothetical protein